MNVFASAPAGAFNPGPCGNLFNLNGSAPNPEPCRTLQSALSAAVDGNSVFVMPGEGAPPGPACLPALHYWLLLHCIIMV